MKPAKERKLQTQIIYGPVESRRLGRSLGVNVLPTQWKVCTFDCVYCQYGWTCCQYDRAESHVLGLPSAVDVEEELEMALPAAGRIDALTLAGNGEPTLHPRFEDIARVTAAARDRHSPGTPVVILSNSSTIADPSVRQAFRWIDRPVMKLDAGSEELFRAVNRPRPEIGFDSMIEALASLGNIEIQSMFFEGAMGNAGDEAVDRWLDILERIAPAAVQVYSLDRTTAESNLAPLTRESLERIAAAARQRLPGARVEVY